EDDHEAREARHHEHHHGQQPEQGHDDEHLHLDGELGPVPVVGGADDRDRLSGRRIRQQRQRHGTERGDSQQRVGECSAVDAGNQAHVKEPSSKSLSSSTRKPYFSPLTTTSARPIGVPLTLIIKGPPASVSSSITLLGSMVASSCNEMRAEPTSHVKVTGILRIICVKSRRGRLRGGGVSSASSNSSGSSLGRSSWC